MKRARGATQSLAILACGVLLAAASGCGGTPSASAPTTSTTTVAGAGSTGPLSAPKTSTAQDGVYFVDIAKADPALAPYVQKYSNVALRALLTDGSAFCAFLKRGGGIDNALTSVAAGANSVESQTHLPQTVRTFNSIEAVALVALCPSEQSLIPAQDRTKIQALGKSLSAASE